MSYRELRNFKEILTVLGYPRLISIENFKTPHFELVADILIWLCQRYDKNMEILDTITTEHDRVAFLKSVAEQLLTKARVKLNLKNLYASNGFAVRELLKVATLLYDAHRNASGDAEEGEGDAAATADVGPGHKFTDVKATRRLASDITKYGIRLYELLGTHVEAKEAAARALGKNYDIDDMGRQLREMEGAVSEQTAQMEQMLGNVQQDEANLQSKIDKKKTELDRQQKRLQSLQTVRPAFMDEFERLEEELSAHYHYYLQNHRNLAYLESELEKIEFAEQEKMDENDRQLKMMQRRLREEELRILRGQAKVDESAIDSQLAEGGRRQLDGGGGRPVGARAGGRPGGAGGGMPRGGGMEADPNVTGGMMMPDDSGSPSDDEDEDDSDEGVEFGGAGGFELDEDEGETGDDDGPFDDDEDDGEDDF